MGFYLRKSVKVGPIRFNFSKSGIGTSVGVKGFRVGSGPRGNYVHVGRHGLYYRQTFPSSAPGSRTPNAPPTFEPLPPVDSHEPLQEIDSADVSQMCDSSSAALLAELDAKQRFFRWWPATLVGWCLWFGFLVSRDVPAWALVLTGVIAVGVTFYARRMDEIRKSVVLFYDFDEVMEQRYDMLHQWASALAGCGGVWHVSASGAVRDRKYHAGASTLVRRYKTSIRKAAPPYVKTNIEVVSVGVGSQTLYFFPDRCLVYEGSRVGAISYPDLQVRASKTSFIEEGAVPRDATIVEYTWQYVNKGGGPDRRFKNNRRLPVCRYGELHFTSASGLNELIQVSRHDLVDGFASVVAEFAAGHRSPSEGPLAQNKENALA